MMIAVILIVSFALNVCFAALLFMIASKSLSKLDESHVRTTEYTKDLVDRLMAVDYVELQATKSAMGIPAKMEPTPEELEPRIIPTQGPDIGGFGSRLGLRALSSVPDPHDLEEELRRDLP